MYSIPSNNDGVCVVFFLSVSVEQFTSEHPNCTNTIYFKNLLKTYLFFLVLYNVVTVSNPRVCI